jgi:hypothetical protein
MEIKPFPNCPALDGYHCQTSSLAKIFHFHNHPLSEDMLLGLGSGMGFIYWKMKMGQEDFVFIGGRGNNKGFFNDIGLRTGVKIRSIITGSAKKAEDTLVKKLSEEEPVMLFGDMGFLPWFEFPEEYHFGGHTFVACGYDGIENVLCSDMDPKITGLKKGFYHPVTLKQLSKARGSKFKPFPPQNCYLEFDFSGFRQPDHEDIYSAIKQTIDSQMNPPIKNIGIKGIKHASNEIMKWPEIFSDHELRMNLFSLYIYIDVGGTGGGCFRYMYSRFLTESVVITKNDRLLGPSEKFRRSGKLFSAIAQTFVDAERADDLKEKIRQASVNLNSIYDIESEALKDLSDTITS